jgi:hypothetical protein
METAGCEPYAILITWTVIGQKIYFVSSREAEWKIKDLRSKDKMVWGER